MSNQVDFRFQFSTDSPYILLVKYLSPKNKALSFPRQNMIIWAIAAFWYPIACKWLGGFSESDLKSKARTAIYQLQQQIIYLAHTFNLEQELGQIGIVAPTTLNNNHIDGINPSLTVPLATTSELHHSQNDDRLLDNAFN
ncbi:hypothetical protein WKK05_40970 (plasmid) [Nostoc sp. UHCC 0302]|uniref:hypothetical protein n=1 Tax=Nostoc sp. UHCC 0302 TaxID=3134896 RepID=UPI00311C9686